MLQFNYTKELIEEIDLCSKRIKAKTETIKDLENELYLLKRQQYNKLQNITIIIDAYITNEVLDGFIIQSTGKDKEGKKLDNRRKYKELEDYKIFKRNLAEYLEIDDIDIYHFSSLGYGVEAHFIEFNYAGHQWELCVPRVRNIEFKSYEMHGKSAFMYRLSHKRNETFYDEVGSTFDVNDLPKILQEGIKKYTEEKSNEQSE